MDKENSKLKALEIINSCVLPEHLEAAKTYIELFNSQYLDSDSYSELISAYNQKVSTLISE